MSVLKSQRGESPVQYLETAYNLEVCTIRQALKFPKRYTFFIATEIVRLASECHNNVKAANGIYPTNAHEAQMRRDYLTAANAALQNLLSKIDIAKGLFPIDGKALEKWAGLIADEVRLIAAVKKSDTRRHKDLA